MADYPVYKFIVKEEGTNTGMLAISLVDDPAIMSNWQTFDAEKEEPQYIALKDENGEYNNELLGPVLRPDLQILRRDDAGNYYYGVFEKEVIKTIRNKFHKQKKTSEVNLMHDNNLKVEGFLIESYIIETEKQLEAVKELGLENIEIGAWIARYKIESDEVFQKALDGEINGFSIEVLLERELLSLKNNFNQKNKSIMGKFNELIDRFKQVITEFEETETENTETKLEDVTVAETDMVLRYTEVGQPVLEVTVDEAGEETTVAAAEGEYVLEDGRTLVVDADGNLAEIREVEGEGDETAEPVTDEEMSDENSEEKTEEKLAEEGEEESSTGSDLTKSLSDLIPVDKDGTYQLEVYVSDGKISFGTLYAWTYKDLQLSQLTEEFETLKTEKENLNSEVEKLQEEIKKPVTNPVFTEFKGDKNKTKDGEVKKFKNNLEYTLHRLGLDGDK